MLAGGAVKAAASEVAGCAIAMPERDKSSAHAQISYEKTIAPMLIDKCVACHRDGGIGPWQMTSYDMINGFAPMIREVVRTQRMPPWHADPHYSVFSNDRGLSTEQAQHARALDRSRRAARHRRRSAARAEEGLAGVAARQARPDRRAAGVHDAGDRHDSVPDDQGRESARSRRVGARRRLPAGPAQRRCITSSRPPAAPSVAARSA